jgi:hypothetical protein
MLVPVETRMKEGFSTGKAMVALQRAIVATFDDGRWQELGYLLGEHEAVVNHHRLLRSLHWGDSDYGGHVFDVLENLLGPNFNNLQQIEEFVGLREWLRQKDQVLYAELYDDDEPTPVVPLEQVEAAAVIHDVVELKARWKNPQRYYRRPRAGHRLRERVARNGAQNVIGDHNLRPSDDIPALLKKARTELDLDPNAPGGTSPAADSLRRTLSSLGQVVVGVAEVRNLYGTGHGRSKSHELEIAHSRLVVNAAVSIATFLLEVWQDRNQHSR